ncbi:MAG: hypothetical protein V5A16_04025 [Haloplanus sp.]
MTADRDDADHDPDAGGESPSDDDAPLDELAREVRARRTAHEAGGPDEAAPDAPSETATASDDDLFETVDVDAVDDEAVWESFVEGEMGPEERVGRGAAAEPVSESDEHVVPKRDFCQRCPHFADPPETACTHEGTTIVEVVDTDHFRVRDCPIVADEDDAAFD